MIKYILMDSEYCSMGRWISVIVAQKMKMKLYVGSDLALLSEEEWLTPAYLAEFDNRIAHLSMNEARQDLEVKKVYEALEKAIIKACEIGPCIIHERAASKIIKQDCLKVLLYNTNTHHKIPRAKMDKSYCLTELSDNQIIEFMKIEDNKRRVYHDAISESRWGLKENYDICLDSDVLGREKCAEILIEAIKDVSLDLEECQQIIRDSFSWNK